MAEFKGTKGWAEVRFLGDVTVVYVGGTGIVARFSELVNHEHEANAKLFADALNVRQKIDQSLPELLDQRNDLLGIIKSQNAKIDELEKELEHESIA